MPVAKWAVVRCDASGRSRRIDRVVDVISAGRFFSRRPPVSDEGNSPLSSL